MCGREDRGWKQALLTSGQLVTAVKYVMLCYIRRNSQLIQADGRFPFVLSLCL